MADTALDVDLIKIFSSLSAIPLACKDKSKALKRITELGKEALAFHACTLVFVDLENKYLTQEACAGFDKDFEERMAGRNINIGSLQDRCFLDFDLIATGEVVEKYDLQRDGQGVANPKTAQRYNLNRVLSSPLKSDDRLIGYFNHFSSKPYEFTAADKNLLEIFAHQAVITIERLEYHRTLDRSLSILNALSKSLLLTSPAPEAFLKQVSDKACELLSAPICIVWKLDERTNKLQIVATTGDVDDAYMKIELNPDDIGIKRHLSGKRVAFLSDVTKSHPKYGHSTQASARGWISLLSAPMLHEDRIIGMLDVYMKNTRYFKEWEKEFFGGFSNHAAVSIQKAELLCEAEANLTSKQTLEKLNEIVKEITEATDVESLLELILNRGLELVGANPVRRKVGKPEMKKVGVDLGGRWLRIGVIDPINNAAIRQPDTPRNGPQSWKEFVDIILSIGHKDVEGYGIAVAGPVENHSTVIRGPNLPWLNGRNVRQELEWLLGGRVIVSNDMEAAAEGEMARGILQHYKWAIFDTISTGWGGCLILDGQRIDGEPGHMNVSSDPRYLCGCGRIGCYEAHYSGSAMKRRILQELCGQNIAFAFDSDVSDSRVWEHFHRELDAGTSWAVSLLDDWAEGVGKAWANALNRIRPLQAIVYMGTTAEKLIPKAEERLRDTIRRISIFPEHRDIPIQLATEPNRSIYGAIIVYDKYKDERLRA